MNELYSGLTQYREQLRDAIERDLDRPASRFGLPERRILKFGLPAAAAAAAAAALVVALPGGAPLRNADAAVLRHVAAALAPAPGTILHERATVTVTGQAPHRYELWAQSDAPQAYRVIKFGHEGSWDGSKFESYDASTNSITVGPSGPAGGRGGRGTIDIATTLRSMVQSGQARVEGTTTVDGTPAYQLIVSGSDDRFLNGTAYVSKRNYHPLLIQTTAGGGERIQFDVYEYLPARGRNLSLLDMEAAHPGAKLVNSPAYPEPSSRTKRGGASK